MGRDMKLTVNGRPEEVAEGLTIAQLLARDKLEHIRVAVEVNGQVVPRQNYDKVRLHENDSLEVVTLVGGG